MGAQALLWVTWIGAAAWFTLCIGVVAWALRGERPRSARRCPRCWHDLSHSEGLTCTECGYMARSERALARRRTRRAPAYLALVGMGAGVLLVREMALQSGWMGLIPDSALVWSMRWTSPEGWTSPLWQELSRRFTRGLLAPSDHTAVIVLASEGSRDAPPASAEWRAHFGRMLRIAPDLEGYYMAREPDPSLRAAHLGSAIAALDSIPPAVDIQMPPLCGTDEPLAVRLAVEDWRATETVFRIRLRWSGAVPLNWSKEDRVIDGWLERAPEAGRHSPLLVPLGRLPVGVHGARILAEWIARPAEESDREGGWEAGEPVETRGSVTVIPSVRALLPEAGGEELDAAVATINGFRVIRWEEGPRAAAFSIGSAVDSARLQGTALGLVIEALEGGVVRRALRGFWIAGTARSLPTACWELVEEDEAALRRIPDDGAGWSVRIRSDPRLAARAASFARADPEIPDATRAWVGVVEGALVPQVQDGSSGSRPWILVPQNEQ